MTLQALCLAGPTASGKSAAALAIADALPAEIISVDSAQVYLGMDIGTAKPSAAERAAVPHHLIDIVDPRDAYSAARFVADATRIADEIKARGRVPLLVGGTMLYFKALFDGLDALPQADASIRAQIDALAAAQGWPALHAELARVDPATAARLQPHDRQRVQRALEVYRASGQPLSALQRRGERRARASPPLLALEPTDRGLAARTHRGALPHDAQCRVDRRGACAACARRPARGLAVDARGRLSADLASARRRRARRYRSAWHRGDAPARKAPIDVAARDAAARRHRVR